MDRRRGQDEMPVLPDQAKHTQEDASEDSDARGASDGTPEDASTAGDDAAAGQRSSRSRPLRALLVLLLLAADAALVIAWGRGHTVEAPVFHLDGAFQTASGLLRLQAGDLPGRDFLPYLGIGPVLLLYPVFLLAGGTLTGSAFAAWTVTAALTSLSAGVVLASALRARTAAAVLGGAGLLLVVLLTGPDVLAHAPVWVQTVLSPLLQLGEPGNSLRPIRASAPLLLVATTALALGRLPRTAGLVVVGAAFGTVMACWSNDYALAPSAAVLAFVVHHGVRICAWRRREIALLGASLVTAALVAGFSTTAGHYLDYAAYNFRDVLGDQFWYFGAWSGEIRVFTPGDLVRLLGALGAGPGAALLAIATALALTRPRFGWTAIAGLGWAAFTGGAVAVVGGHADDYLLPFRAWTVLAASGIALAGLRWSALRAVLRAGRAVRLSGLRPLISIALVSLLALVAAQGLQRATEARATAAADTTQRFVASLGGYLPLAFAQHLSAAPTEGRFVEEYAGLWTALRGPNHRQRVDAVIHALGHERDRFVAVLKDSTTTAAVTTSPQLSGEWVSWNISANWPFYRELLRRFVPQSTSPTTIGWKRTPGAAEPTAGRCRVAADGRSVTVIPAASGLNEVTLTYRGPGRGARAFSMFRNGIDTAADAAGYVALDPGADQQAVPVYASDLAAERYDLRDVPDRPRTTITGCRTASVPFPPGSTAEDLYAAIWATSTSPIELTDANWEHGLGRGFAAFLVRPSAPNLAAYRTGGRVRLADGQVRSIIDATAAGDLLTVRLDGAPLPQTLLAAPRPFEAER